MKSKLNIILLLLALSQFLVVLDASIINVALPAMNAALGFNPSSLQWVLTAYILTFGGFLMLGGRAADLFGRRRVLVSGVVGFTSISLLLGLSVSGEMLIALRALQGLAAAFMAPAALSILLTTFQEGHQRNKALSVMSGIGAGGAAVGVLLGGLLTEYFGWRSIFLVNVPIGLFITWGLMKYVPAHIKEERTSQLDLRGALLITTSLMALVYALTQVPETGWFSIATLGLLALSATIMAAFIVNERKVTHPLVPLSIFRVRNVSGANLAMLPVIAGAFGLFFFSSLYVQNVLAYSPALTGLSFLPAPVIIGLLSLYAPKLIARYGFKPLMLVGFSTLTIGMLVFSALDANSGYFTHLLPGLALLGLGVGLSFVALAVAATSGVPSHEAGLASGLFNTSQQLGGAIGVAILTAVSAAVTSAATSAGHGMVEASLLGYQRAFLLTAIFMGVALLIGIFMIQSPKKAAVAVRASVESA